MPPVGTQLPARIIPSLLFYGSQSYPVVTNAFRAGDNLTVVIVPQSVTMADSPEVSNDFGMYLDGREFGDDENHRVTAHVLS